MHITEGCPYRTHYYKPKEKKGKELVLAGNVTNVTHKVREEATLHLEQFRLLGFTHGTAYNYEGEVYQNVFIHVSLEKCKARESLCQTLGVVMVVSSESRVHSSLV